MFLMDAFSILWKSNTRETSRVAQIRFFMEHNMVNFLIADDCSCYDSDGDVDNFPRHEEVKAEREAEGKTDYREWTHCYIVVKWFIFAILLIFLFVRWL